MPALASVTGWIGAFFMIEEVATPTFTRILRRLDASYNTTIQMMLSQYKDALGKKELVEVQDWYRDDLFPKS
jgi:uncharacterized membrane protein YccC